MPGGGAAARGGAIDGDPAGAEQGGDGLLGAGEARASCGRLAQHVELLIGWVEADGDITMPELAAKLLAEHSVTAHPASLSRLLIRHGFTVKKRCWRGKPITLTLSGDGG